MARLIHLNGAPGTGKSTLARRYVDDHPLALLLEVDALRIALRFRQRRRELIERGDPHPQVDVAEAAIEATLVEAHQRLAALVADRPAVVRVVASAEADEVYATVIAHLAGDGRGARPGI